MAPTKLIAFLLCALGVAGFLFACFLAIGPFLSPEAMADVPFDPGCFSLILFVVITPFASSPGALGLCLWLFSVRKAEQAEEQEIARLPRQEQQFQRVLANVIQDLLDPQADRTTRSEKMRAWSRELTEQQQHRLLLFLSDQTADLRSKSVAIGTSAVGGNAWDPRTLSWLLLAIGAFCILWGIVVLITHLTTGLLPALLHIEAGIRPALIGSLGCFIPGATALLASLGLRWLVRRERRRRQRLLAFREEAQQLALEGFRNHVMKLLTPAMPQNAEHPSAQALLLSTLPELGDTEKGVLLSWLHAGSLLSELDLNGVDFSGALLEGRDLSGAPLGGINLSHARLNNTSLRAADLHESCLRAAHLQGARAEGVHLQRSDLRGAWLRDCDLRSADLSDADLTGANLWQTDLAGAVLAGTRVAPSQLATARNAGASRGRR